MKADHLEILVEEPSMEGFLQGVLPKILGSRSTFTIHVHQGKPDLIRKLPSRLRGYAKWLPDTTRIVVLVDRDNDDCRVLKQRLEQAAGAAGLATRSIPGSVPWRVVNRIAVEELEAWFFGEWIGVRSAYPRVQSGVPGKAAYKNCDAISGGTWEAFERLLTGAGYFDGGLRKVEAAREVGLRFNPSACSSPSFETFKNALVEAIT